MKKRLIAMFLALAMVVCMVPGVSAATYSGTCGTNLKWTFDSNTGVLHISGTGAMNDYSQNYEPWHSYNDNIRSVVVEDGCTHIGSWAFAFSESLTSVSLPNSVTSIGADAFDGSTKLVSCPLPDYLTSIGEWAFYGCKALAGLDLPSTLTEIGECAFKNCDNITVADIPGSVTQLPYAVFEDCEKLTTVTFGEGVQSIGESVFRNTGITNIVLPQSMQTLGMSAFKGCENLKVVTMRGCKKIGSSAFQDCDSLRRVTLAENTETIQQYAFAYCDTLTSLRLPASVKSVGYSTCYKSNALKQVILMNPDCEINEYANLGLQGICTIYGYADSTAYTYAIKKGYTFELIGKEGPEPSIFADVPTGAWYQSAVEYAYANGLFYGVGNDSFAPDYPMERAMLVTVLWRYEGQPSDGVNNFTDVPTGKWYTQAIAWAAKNGIVNGIGNNRFDPTGKISREQVASILCRYASWKEIDTSARADLSGFSDSNLVSAWAVSSVQWAVSEGLISGAQNNGKLTLDPGGNASRCQVAAILMRYIENIVK